MNLSDEIIRAILTTFFGIMGTLMSAVIGVSIIVWADVRSLKKAANAAFDKIRALEAKACQAKSDKSGPII